MRGRAVADMLGEAVARIEPIVFSHEAIARDLGDDRSGSDGDRNLVPTDEGPIRDSQIVEPDGINEEEVRARAKPFDRLPHGTLGGAQDIRAINLARVHNSEGDGSGRPSDRLEELLSTARQEAFGIIQTVGEAIEIEDHRSRDDRPGPRPASDFIHAGNEPIAEAAEFPLQSRCARSPSLHPVPYYSGFSAEVKSAGRS